MRQQNLRAYGSHVGRAGNRTRQKFFYFHINQVEATTGEISRSQIYNYGTSLEDHYAKKRISSYVVGRLFPTQSHLSCPSKPHGSRRKTGFVSSYVGKRLFGPRDMIKKSTSYTGSDRESIE